MNKVGSNYKNEAQNEYASFIQNIEKTVHYVEQSTAPPRVIVFELFPKTPFERDGRRGFPTRIAKFCHAGRKNPTRMKFRLRIGRKTRKSRLGPTAEAALSSTISKLAACRKTLRPCGRRPCGQVRAPQGQACSGRICRMRSGTSS